MAIDMKGKNCSRKTDDRKNTADKQDSYLDAGSAATVDKDQEQK